MIYILAQQAAASQPYWLILIVALISSGVVTGVLNYWFNRKKNDAETEHVDAETEHVDAEAADIIQRAAGELIEKIRVQAALSDLKYQEQNQKLIEQNAKTSIQLSELQVQVSKIPELEASIADLRLGVQLLTDQLKEHNINPVYSFHPPSPPAF